MGACAVVVAAFAFGLGVAGSPATQRRIEADHRRVEDLRSIARAVHFAQPRPASLEELVASQRIQPGFTLDPETRKPYEYRVKSGSVYELCANFSAAEEPGRYPISQFWHHGPGRTCFTLDPATAPEW